MCPPITPKTTVTAKARATKFRPSLTALHLTHLANLCKNEVPLSFKSIQVLGILVPFLEKIEAGTLAPSYLPPSSSSSSSSLIESLGGTPLEAANFLPKEQRWELAYKKACTLPIEQLTPSELADANEHKYLNDLMTDEELVAFERAAALELTSAELTEEHRANE